MPKRSYRAWLLPLLATILTAAILGAALLPRLLDLETYKGEIVAQVKTALKRDLTYESADFSLRYGLSFTFQGVAIKEKELPGDFIRADRLTISLAILPLLRREIVLSRMHIDRPVLNLSRNKDGVFNIADLFSAPPSGGPSPGIRGIDLKKARITFTDHAVSAPPLVTQLSDTDLYLSRLARGQECDFKLSGDLSSRGAKVPLFLAGVAMIPAAGEPLLSTEIAGRIRTGALDAGHFWPYYRNYVPFKSLSGALALEGSYRGRLNSAFKSEGEFEITRLNMDYPQVFHARLTPKSLKSKFEMELKDDVLDIRGIKLNLDGLQVEGSCRLSDLRSKDPRITAQATTNRFNLANFRQYVPYGIIPAGVSHFIEQKITGGVYRLTQGRLDGRVSQILHMERGTNYNVLSIKAEVEEGTVAYGGGWPVFSALKGELLLAGKDFVLKGMTGRFGSSPMSLEGRIADYCLHVPTRYLFTANVQARQPEAVWIVGEKLSLSDGASVKITGQGTDQEYHLSGECDLTASSYTFSDLVAKPQGRPNTGSFAVTLDANGYRFTDLTYHLAPLSFSASMAGGYRGPVGLELKTNQFQGGEIFQMSPLVRKYHPAGKFQAQLRGAGPGFDRLTWNGNVQLTGASIKAGEKLKPLTGATGNLRISGETVEASQLTARVGNSVITGRGTLNGFDNPSWSATFSSPLLDLSDLGLVQAPPQGAPPPRAEKVQGALSYTKDHLQIGTLSGGIGKSNFQIRGSVRELQNPVADLTINSSYLELDDLVMLFAGPSGEGGGTFTLKAKVAAAEGKLSDDILVQRFKSVVMLENKILYLQPFELQSMEGEVRGRLRVDFAPSTPRYQLNCEMNGISAERFMRVLKTERQELTGKLWLQADLNARGENLEEWRRTALGAVKLKVEDGKLRKFSTLSKIFSILNVSQLVKGQLPDMVSGGMPYEKITGDLAFQGGAISTENLYMDSNAISLSAVGKIDMVKSQMDMTIGVKPLQTVDKVVSKIPIVGWVLTGKDRSLITTYFEAKGPVADPKVTAVPVRSLAKGVFNIFKRVFQLPEKLITDTGEVFIGK